MLKKDGTSVLGNGDVDTKEDVGKDSGLDWGVEQALNNNILHKKISTIDFYMQYPSMF